MEICLHTVGSFGITNKKQIKLLHFSSNGEISIAGKLSEQIESDNDG